MRAAAAGASPFASRATTLPTSCVFCGDAKWSSRLLPALAKIDTAGERFGDRFLHQYASIELRGKAAARNGDQNPGEHARQLGTPADTCSRRCAD